MSRRLRRLLLAAPLGGALVLAGVVRSEYLRFAGEVGTFFDRMTPAERHPPEVLGAAFTRVHPKGLASQIVFRIRPEGESDGHIVSMLREALWARFLRYRYSEGEVLAAYAKTLVFESGKGLQDASRFYFQKEPESLKYEECLSIVVMDISPHAYSMRRDPERFKKALAKYL